jgi:uncharacterized protein with PQ loop repeat
MTLTAPITFIGLLAGACTAITFVPQVIKTGKIRSAKDLSLGMYLIFFAHTALWLAYGLLISDYSCQRSHLFAGIDYSIFQAVF